MLSELESEELASSDSFSYSFSILSMAFRTSPTANATASPPVRPRKSYSCCAFNRRIKRMTSAHRGQSACAKMCFRSPILKFFVEFRPPELKVDLSGASTTSRNRSPAGRQTGHSSDREPCPAARASSLFRSRSRRLNFSMLGCVMIAVGWMADAVMRSSRGPQTWSKQRQPTSQGTVPSGRALEI